MSGVIKEKHYIVISLFCAIIVFWLSMAFQKMAYWGNGLFWYWVGVAITALIWLTGKVFLVRAVRSNKLSFIYLIGYIVSSALLLIGFLWVIFIIAMGSPIT